MKTFEERVKEDKPSLVVFVHADQADNSEIEKQLEELVRKYGDRINVLHVDASYDHKLKHQYAILHYPTYVLLRRGEELMRETGKKTITQLEELVERAF